MKLKAQLDRLTSELCEAAGGEDLTPALDLLARRQSLLSKPGLPAPADLPALLARQDEAISALRERRNQLAQEITRLKRARGRLDSFHPARHPRRRIDMKM